MGRRIEKKVWQWQAGGGWGANPITHIKYVWDGWLLLEELNALSSNAVTKKYTWGLDLAGLNGSVNDRTSAGGIGGLLAMRVVSGSADYSYFYDGNGNVGQLIQWSQSTAANATKAKYEYDPYGNSVSSTGSAAGANDFRFSTKLLDPETGLYYYGYRYYSPKLGRWVSRDPAGEDIGGINLAAFVINDPMTKIDSLGESWGPVEWWWFFARFQYSPQIGITPAGASASDCGTARFSVSFSVPTVLRRNSGFIIQHIRLREDVTDCCGVPLPPRYIDTSYWEAWRFDGPEVTPESFGVHDRFRIGDYGSCTKGTVTAVGEAKIVIMTKLPPDFIPRNVPLAGDLPSTRTKPFGWDWTPTGAKHSLIATWNCCDDPCQCGTGTRETTQIEVSPR
jgi:RHS repeat-associated protein